MRNERVSARWSKRTGENFGVFSARKVHVLSLNGVTVCLKFYILGSCSSNCPRISTHVPLSGDASVQTSEFAKNCRDHDPPAIHDGATISAPSPSLGPDHFDLDLK